MVFGAAAPRRGGSGGVPEFLPGPGPEAARNCAVPLCSGLFRSPPGCVLLGPGGPRPGWQAAIAPRAASSAAPQ
eukprot:6618516-Lingulodinium_polyedra.AAC.1